MSWPRAEVLTTRRLRLDPLTVAAADELVAVLADPALYRFTGGSPPSADELRRRHRAQAAGTSPDGSQGWLNWIVRDLATGRAIGYVQATVERTGHGLTADLAWVIDTGRAGRGFATEAATAMLCWLGDQGVTTATAHIHPEHRASIRIAERLGLVATDEVADGERVWRTAGGAQANMGPRDRAGASANESTPSRTGPPRLGEGARSGNAGEDAGRRQRVAARAFPAEATSAITTAGSRTPASTRSRPRSSNARS